MFKNKQQVDKHINGLLAKITDPKERQLKAYQFAKLYLEVKEYESAKRCIETYLTVKSRHAQAYMVKAEALEGLGDLKNALESYQHAFELDSSKKNILPKICHLICEIGNLSSNEMRFWLEMCEKFCPNQKIIFKLSELLNNRGRDNSTFDREKYLLDELRNNPTDDKNSISYLEYLLSAERHTDALKFCTNIDYYKMFYNSLLWFESVVKALEELATSSSLLKDNPRFEKFYLLALCACLRLGLSKRSYAELQSLLERLDKSMVLRGAHLSNNFVREMSAQIYFYAACLLHKMSAISDPVFGPAISFCYAAAYSVPLFPFASSGEEESNNTLIYIHQESLLRLSQAGHVVYQLRHGTECPYLQFLEDSDDVLCNLVFPERVDHVNSVLKKCNIYIEWKRFLTPMWEDLSKLDQELIQRFPSCLPLIVWVLMQHDQPSSHILVIPKGTEFLDFLLNMLNDHYSVAQFSCSDHPGDSEITPESLCQLDLFCFLVGTLRYCQATLIHDLHGETADRVALPFFLINTSENRGRPSGEHIRFWSIVSGLLSKTGVQLGRNRLNLQRGLEQLRVGRLPLPLLLHISHALDMLKNQLDPGKRTICSNWEDFFWKCSLQGIDMIPHSVASGIRTNDHSLASPASLANRYTSLFPIEEDYLLEISGHRDSPALYSAWRERALLRRAELAAQRGYLRASVDMLNSSQSALAAQKQGQLVLRSLQEEPATYDLQGADTNLGVLVQRAKDYFMTALDRLDGELDPKIRQLLNEKIMTDLEEVREFEDSHHLTGIPAVDSIIQNRKPPSTPSNFNDLNTSNTLDKSAFRASFVPPGDSSTPARPGAAARPSSRPTPERLETQLKMLSHSHERVISQILDHNKNLQESNSKLSQLVLENSMKTKEATTKLSDVITELEESRKLMRDLKRQMTDLEEKWHTFSVTQQQQSQQLAAAVSLQPTLITANIQQALQLAALQQQQAFIQQQQRQAPATIPLSMHSKSGIPVGQQFVAPGSAAHDFKSGASLMRQSAHEGFKLETTGDEECDDDLYYYEEDYDSSQQLLANGCWPYGTHPTLARVPNVSQANQNMPAPGFFNSPGPKQPSSYDFTIGNRPLLKEFEKSMSSSNAEATNPTTSQPVKTAADSSPFGGFSFNPSDSTTQPSLFDNSSSQFGKGNTSNTTSGPLTSAAETAKGLFSFTSPSSSNVKQSAATSIKSPGEDNDTSHPEDFVPNVDFTPIVSLPSVVKLTTGEEGEKEIFNDRCQLFRYVKETREWKTRGTGQIKILKHKSTGAYRIIMRRDQVKKLCANHQLNHLMKLDVYPNVRNAFMWHAQDYADEELKNEMFACRFKTESQAASFEKIFNDAIGELAALAGVPKSPQNRTTVNTTIAAVPSLNVSTSSTKTTFSIASPITSTVSPSTDSLLNKLKPKSGSWECSCCSIYNDANKITCIACSTPKPEPSGNSAASSSNKPLKSDTLLDKFKPQPGSWECPMCMISNSAESDACVACTNSRPSVGNTPKPSTGNPPQSSILKGLLFNPSSTTKSDSPFSFNVTKSNTSGGFTFGGGSSVVPVQFGSPAATIATTSNKSSFSFGPVPSASSTATTTTSGFTFAHVAAASTTSGGFSFVSSKTSTSNTLFGSSGSTSTSTSNTLFGSGSTSTYTSNTFGSGSTSISTSNTLFGSGSTSASSIKPSITFTPVSSATSSATTPNKNQFSFVPISNASTPVPKIGFNFGAAVTTSSSNLSTNPTGFTFGTSPAPTATNTSLLDTPSAVSKPPQSSRFNWKPQIVTTTSESAPKPHSGSPFTFGGFDSTPKSSAAEKPKGTGGLFANINLNASEPSGIFTFNKSPNLKATPSKESPANKSKEPTTPGSDNELYVGDEGEHLYFKPLLEKLPEKVDVVTGEEKEEVLFNKRCRLYRWVGKEWKERGNGDMKLLKSVGSDGLNQVRVVMRRDQILKVCCNHLISGEMILKPMNGTQGKAWTWFALDYAEPHEGDSSRSGGAQELFAARFKELADAEEFKKHFMEAVDYRKSQDSTSQGSRTPTKESVDDDFSFSETSSSLSKELVEKARSLKLPDDFYMFELRNAKDRTDDPLDPFDPCEDKALELAVKKGIPKDEDSEDTEILLVLNKREHSKGFPSKNLLATSDSSSSAGINLAPSKFTFSSSQTTTTTTASGGLFNNSAPSGGLFGSASFGSPNSKSTSNTAAATTTSSTASGLFGSFFSSAGPKTTASSGLFGSFVTSQTATSGGPSEVTFSFANASSNMTDFSSLAQNNTDKHGIFGGNNNQSAGSGDFTWAGQDSKLFASFKPRDSHDGGGDSGDDDVEAEANVHFDPVVPLPDKIKVETGEEKEDCIFKQRARLYRYCENQWKERGIGEMKIMRSKDDPTACRLVMRRDQIHKVCCNHKISVNCPKFMPMSTCPKSTCWNALDFSESNEGEQTKLAIRFKTPAEVEEFKKIVTDIQNSLNCTSESGDTSAEPKSSQTDEVKEDPAPSTNSKKGEPDTVFTKRVTLSVRPGPDQNPVTQHLGELFAIREEAGVRVQLIDKSNVLVCNHVIKPTVSFTSPKKKPSVFWIADDPDSQDHNKQFHVMFSSKPALVEFKNLFPIAN